MTTMTPFCTMADAETMLTAASGANRTPVNVTTQPATAQCSSPMCVARTLPCAVPPMVREMARGRTLTMRWRADSLTTLMPLPLSQITHTPPCVALGWIGANG